MRRGRFVRALAIAALLAAPSLVFAQEKPEGSEGKKPEQSERREGGPGGPGFGEEYPKMIARFLKDQVELSEEQTTKVEGILRDAFRDAMKKMFARMGD